MHSKKSCIFAPLIDDTDMNDIDNETHLPKTEKPTMIKTEISQLKGVTIVGKIDLDAINPKIRPKKKSRAVISKEKEERYKIEAEKRIILREARRAKRKADLEKIKEQEKLLENTPLPVKPLPKKTKMEKLKDIILLKWVGKWRKKGISLVRIF